MRYRVATLALLSSPTGYVACAVVSSCLAAASELSLESTPITASSARQSGHHDAKKLTITGVPRNEASDTASLPSSGGSENAGAVVPGLSVVEGGDSSAAVPGPVGCDGPRTTTKTTNPMRVAPATAATHLNTWSVPLGRRRPGRVGSGPSSGVCTDPPASILVRLARRHLLGPSTHGPSRHHSAWRSAGSTSSRLRNRAARVSGSSWTRCHHAATAIPAKTGHSKV